MTEAFEHHQHETRCLKCDTLFNTEDAEKFVKMFINTASVGVVCPTCKTVRWM